MRIFAKKSKSFFRNNHAELRERRLKTDKILRWSILSESPSNYATKGQAFITESLKQVQGDGARNGK